MKDNQKQKGGIAAKVRTIITPVADSLGLRLWDVEWVKEGAEMVLRVTIDNDAGITIDDCEAMHRAIDPVLDEADPIEDAYRLEVSSPGVERVVSLPEHYEFCTGSEIEVKLYAPVNGSKVIRGILASHDDDAFTVKTPDGDVTVRYADAAKVHTVFDW